MLKFREANYMNVHNLRRVHDNCPPHFEKVRFNLYVHEKEISDWIHENTDGRFWVGPIVEELNGRNDINYQVGFEMPSEASYFALMLEQFNPSSRNW
jgi:hypothetical protein